MQVVQKNCKSKVETDEKRDEETACERIPHKNVFKREFQQVLDPRTKPDCPQENQIFDRALSQSDKAHGPKTKMKIQSLFKKSEIND